MLGVYIASYLRKEHFALFIIYFISYNSITYRKRTEIALYGMSSLAFEDYLPL